MSPVRRWLLAPGALWTVAALLVIWQAVVVTQGLPSHLLPSPLQVMHRMWIGIAGGDMLPHLGATLTAAAMGYVIGAAVALSLAVALSESRVLERAVYPVVLFFQSVPKVSVAPLIFIWAGFGMRSQVALVALICFFPLFTSTFAGLKAVDANLVSLFRVAGASPLHTLLHMKIPAAAGAVFVGFQISVVFALVGCVVMEFINATQGIGFLIVDSSNTLDTTTSVAAMILLGLLGLAASSLVRLVRERVVFWEGGATTGGFVAKEGAQ